MNLSDCKITQFGEDLFTNLTQLKVLDQSYNKIITYWRENLQSMQRALGSLNKAPLHTLKLAHLLIRGGSFCDHKRGQTGYSNLKSLDLSWNQIIVPYSRNWNCLITLETLNLSGNDMEDIKEKYNSFEHFTSLKILILSQMRTTLKIIGSEALRSDSLQHLDLSGNDLDFENRKKVANDTFNYFPNLISLDISDNILGSVGAKTLPILSHLETLIMRHAYINQLPDDFLGHFPNLRYLDLSSNKIEEFSANAFQNATQLEFLNISENLISDFPAPPFDLSALKSLETFDFAKNYFQCDCDIFKLQKWISEVLNDPNKKNLFPRYPGDYFCHKPHLVYRTPLKDAIPTHCKNDRYELVLSVACSVFICLVFTVVLIVAYVYRWEIKFLLHKMRQKRRGECYPLTYTFEYNTYVAYAEKDSAWVIHDLLKELEEAKYNVYIRDRYSVPGMARCDEIVDNIYKRKTVILVLSKNFMACQWCNYQLNVAQERAVKLRPKFMIPILLEEIDILHMKKSVQYLFRTSEPIEWERQSTKNKLVWSELKIALHEEINQEFEETGYLSCDVMYVSVNANKQMISCDGSKLLILHNVFSNLCGHK
ncbi:hypothetical protein CHS0354_009779 [Potamilus streckersoni]|uniref:TIR domain-containing protein n=1 Tax=Potamilus streckersoni TaxID=2493646 RepID=A0AAE0SV25_9BIVA|nr:hypothetical protein CHS0354_009779 [Potamilus streckersoni]